MQLKGITIDFDDKRTCGLLPELCLQWDERSDELEDNQELLDYWERNFEEVTSHTKSVVAGNIGTKSIVYSADRNAIKVIRKVFKELELDTIDYNDIIKCENCLKLDYLDENFIPDS